MILDRLNHAELYRPLAPRLWQGFAFLLQSDLEALTAGRHVLDGENLFAIVDEYTTKPEQDCKFEAHRKYVDIQCVVHGIERIGWGPLAAMQETIPYSEEKDIAFFIGQGDWLTLTAGTFAVFFPHDCHRPGAEAGPAAVVKKVVVKVAL